MKKSLFLLPLLAISLAACGGKSSAGGEAGGGSSSLIETYDFSSLTENSTTALTSETIATTLGPLGTCITTWGNTEKVYQGGGTGGSLPNQTGLVKMGTSSQKGYFSFTVNEAVAKVVINCHDWFKSDATADKQQSYLDINGVREALPRNADATGEDIEIVLTTPATDLTITSCNSDNSGFGRGYLFSISFYR